MAALSTYNGNYSQTQKTYRNEKKKKTVEKFKKDRNKVKKRKVTNIHTHTRMEWCTQQTCDPNKKKKAHAAGRNECPGDNMRMKNSPCPTAFKKIMQAISDLFSLWLASLLASRSGLACVSFFLFSLMSVQFTKKRERYHERDAPNAWERNRRISRVVNICIIARVYNRFASRVCISPSRRKEEYINIYVYGFVV